jgi:hypothetical protein
MTYEQTYETTGAERGLRSPDARAFNAPLYLLSYLGLIWCARMESNHRPRPSDGRALIPAELRALMHVVTW